MMAEKTLSELGHDALCLASIIEGLDVLYTAADGPTDCPVAKRARNALIPMIEVSIEKAWALNEAIEETESAGRA